MKSRAKFALCLGAAAILSAVLNETSTKSFGALNAAGLDFEITSTDPFWIWTGTAESIPSAAGVTGYSTTLQNEFSGKTASTAGADGKVTASTGGYFLYNGEQINSVSVKGTDSTATNLGELKYNQSLNIGTLTLENASLAYLGRWGTDKCPSTGCATLNVDTLKIDASNTSANLISLGFINAKNTIITGGTTPLTIKASVGSAHQADGSATATPSLGSIEVKNAKIAFQSSPNAEFGTIENLTLGEGASLDTTSAAAGGGTNATKNIVENKVQQISILADAGSVDLSGFDASKILSKLNFRAAAAAGSEEASYFSTSQTPISVNLGAISLPATFYQSKHKVIDNGEVKQSGDETTIYAQSGTSVIANTAMTNYKLSPSDRVRAMLDNAFIARQILLADTLDINSKMMNYKSSKAKLGSNARGDTLYEEERVEGDFWLDYDYLGVKGYGDEDAGELNFKNNAVAFGVGLASNGITRASLFARYTIGIADSADLENSHNTNALNTGVYVSQRMWEGGFLRGQLAYHYISVKGEYVLQNTLAATNTLGSVKHNYHYLTTGVGLEQEINFTDSLWTNVGADINHIMSLSSSEGESEAQIGADSLTMLSLNLALGSKLGSQLLLYAHGQLGFALANYTDGFELNAANTLQGGTLHIDNHAYNGFVANLGVGVAYNALDSLQLTLDFANVAYGAFSSSSFRTKLGVDFRF